MLVITLIGYWYGPATGLLAAFAYGILQFITGPYVVHPVQVLLDYPLAFGALGLFRLLFQKEKRTAHRLSCGCPRRLACHEISGLIFYTTYVGDFTGNAAAIWASVVYNLSYIVPEAVLTVILLLLPPVKKAMDKVTRLATQ